MNGREIVSIESAECGQEQQKATETKWQRGRRRGAVDSVADAVAEARRTVFEEQKLRLVLHERHLLNVAQARAL